MFNEIVLQEQHQHSPEDILMKRVKRSTHLNLLRLMLQVRSFDKKSAMLVRQGRAHVHVSSSGHEGLMAIPFLLNKEDYLFPYYRGSHLMLGKGITIKELVQDFLAKPSSTSGGRSMVAHCGSFTYKVFPSAAPTASQCLPAVGSAWAQKMDKLNHLTVCSIGDGATREGEFYEAVCHAVQEQLPIIFLVEDNQYAISTPTAKFLPFQMGIFNQELLTQIDGRDVLQVLDCAARAIEKVRQGLGPSILWCSVDRLDSHTVGEDHRLYRTPDELAALCDPIQVYAAHLIKQGHLTEEELTKIELSLQNDVFATFDEVLENQKEEPDLNIKEHLYGAAVTHRELFTEFPLSQQISQSSQTLQPPQTLQTPLTMVDTINLALNLGLQENSNMLLFGQDIEDPKGGVFGFTKGLSTLYPNRVTNAPIAEATIIGAAVGLAVHGYRPVFEIQFIDFITPGFDQLVSQVASLRWRSCSQWSCPMVLYAPYGAYLPAGGLWHSQSNEGWWTHIPGLRVAVPSTPEDAFGLFAAAMQDLDPSLILIPKHITRIKKSVTKFKAISFGIASIVKEGTDVTVVCWGNILELMEKVDAYYSEIGISLEIIDLRSLVPCDMKTIAKSLEKTGRLVVVQEDNKTSSFGSTIISNIVSNTEWFSFLYAPPQLVARDDIHIPYHPSLEYAVLPSVEDVIAAIKNTLTIL